MAWKLAYNSMDRVFLSRFPFYSVKLILKLYVSAIISWLKVISCQAEEGLNLSNYYSYTYIFDKIYAIRFCL